MMKRKLTILGVIWAIIIIVLCSYLVIKHMSRKNTPKPNGDHEVCTQDKC